MNQLLDIVDNVYNINTKSCNKIDRMNQFYLNFLRKYNCSHWQIEMAAKGTPINLDGYLSPPVEESKLFIKLTYLMNGNTIHDYLQDGFIN